MALEEYKRKRDFTVTSEPPPQRIAAGADGFSYLIQKHDATRLHYDFRLELDGVLLSWAVTKGPSLNPADRRLAVRTEDHPLSYGTFEGTIPKGQYGGGTVMLWDRGSWEPKGDPRAGLEKGHLSFTLHGERLKGGWGLIRMRGEGKKEDWLLIKEKDTYAMDSNGAARFLEQEASSVATHRSMDEIAEDAPGSEPRNKAGSTIGEHIRQPSSQGLRKDKKPWEIVMERPVNAERMKSKPGPRRSSKSDHIDVLGVSITHPDRVIFADSRVTKGRLAEYYAAVSAWILKDVSGHPVSLLRCPEGATHPCFYQRSPGKGLGPDVKPFAWKHQGKPHEYLYVENEKGLVELIQMGAIELHPWGARVENIDYPDRLIFDLDPAQDVAFDAVKLAARDLRNRLGTKGLTSYLKCTGGKGLHVSVPLDETSTWAEVKAFCAEIAEQMVRDDDDAYVATMSKQKRLGKIFIDYFRNDYTATAIADFAVRARPSGPVAVPLEWSELGKLHAANQFTIDAVLKRLKRKPPDPARYENRQKLPA